VKAASLHQAMVLQVFIRQWCCKSSSGDGAASLHQAMVLQIFIRRWCYKSSSGDGATSLHQAMVLHVFIRQWCRLHIAWWRLAACSRNIPVLNNFLLNVRQTISILFSWFYHNEQSFYFYLITICYWNIPLVIFCCNPKYNSRLGWKINMSACQCCHGYSTSRLSSTVYSYKC